MDIINRVKPPADFRPVFFSHSLSSHFVHSRVSISFIESMTWDRDAKIFRIQNDAFVGSDTFVRINRRPSDGERCPNSTAVRSLRYIRHLFATDPLLYFGESVVWHFSEFLLFIIQFDFGRRHSAGRWMNMKLIHFNDILIVLCPLLFDSKTS